LDKIIVYYNKKGGNMLIVDKDTSGKTYGYELTLDNKLVIVGDGYETKKEIYSDLQEIKNALDKTDFNKLLSE
jgi:ABC-type phosphate transport system auxiliary subunit